MTMQWGLLGPAFLVGERRTRTLGVGASVRAFNELAVPGMGGVWYGKQLALAALGLQVADAACSQGLRMTRVECANAIEALACSLAFSDRQWMQDARLRGRTKLPREHALDFRSLRRPGFYVSQPMRMATVQALHPLGLVDGGIGRFNSFELSPDGKQLLEVAFGSYLPFKRGLIEHLTAWARGGDVGRNSQALREALSPCVALSVPARRQVRDRLLRGRSDEPQEDKARRRNALAWAADMAAGRDHTTWTRRPESIEQGHWNDLRAGAAFFRVRDAAISALDVLDQKVALAPGERWVAGPRMPADLEAALSDTSSAAQAFLALGHRDAAANTFCRECAQDDPAAVISAIVTRDGRVLRLSSGAVVPGASFRRLPLPDDLAGGVEAGADGPAVASARWPARISYRIRNLFLMHLDLEGVLDEWINGAPVGAAA